MGKDFVERSMAMSIDLYNLVIAAKLTKGGGGGGDIDVDSLTVTENGTYSASSGHAYSPVVVSVPTSGITPTGTTDISSNGIYDVTNFASASVSVPAASPSISALTVTENGTYSVPAGVDGYNPVTVSVSGGGGGDHDAEDGLVMRTLSTYTNSRVTDIPGYAFYNFTSIRSFAFPNVINIGSYAMYGCSSLVSVSFPSATSIGQYGFYNCFQLSSADFPNVTNIGNYAFANDKDLSAVNFPNVTSVGGSVFQSCALRTVSFPNAESIGACAFRSCSKLSAAYFPKVSNIGSSAFQSCTSLMSLYVLASSVITLGTNVFYNTPMSYDGYTGSFGSIYVPASLVDSYKSAAYWSAYSDRITSYVE